jgi:hypothetical protein
MLATDTETQAAKSDGNTDVNIASFLSDITALTFEERLNHRKLRFRPVTPRKD